jgi:soluble lytic murein transglycosylase-like protein
VKASWQYSKTKYTEFILNSNDKVSKKDATDISSAIFKWADYHKIDRNLVFAIAKIESHFDKYAMSKQGAMGLLQVMTKVHIDKLMLAKSELHNPEIFDINTNVFVGTKILKDCLVKSSIEHALETCYSAGANDYSKKVLREYSNLNSMSS